jgi:DNA polymerase-3 subunit chi
MTQVDFYILGETARANRYQFTCRLTEKIYLQGLRVYIHLGSTEDLRHLDRLLWTFRDGSFIPHGILGNADANVTPVLLGAGEQAGAEDSVLINLAPAVPDFFSRFARVAEIIDQDPQVRQAGRARFRFYRDRGYPLDTHEMVQ